MAAAAGRKPQSLFRVQFEVDLHFVKFSAKAFRQRIHVAHPFRHRGHRLIDDNVTRWFDDFELRNASVLFDSQLYERRHFRPGRHNRRRLHPFTIQSVVQHASVPAEL